MFTLVRNIAKDEAPLQALTVNGVIISTIAEVTFYGHDQTGREVSAVGEHLGRLWQLRRQDQLVVRALPGRVHPR